MAETSFVRQDCPSDPPVMASLGAISAVFLRFMRPGFRPRRHVRILYAGPVHCSRSTHPKPPPVGRQQRENRSRSRNCHSLHFCVSHQTGRGHVLTPTIVRMRSITKRQTMAWHRLFSSTSRPCKLPDVLFNASPASASVGLSSCMLFVGHMLDFPLFIHRLFSVYCDMQ